MADISNLKINERANVERAKLRESLQYKMDQQFPNMIIFRILTIFQIKKKIQIPKITNLANSENF